MEHHRGPAPDESTVKLEDNSNRDGLSRLPILGLSTFPWEGLRYTRVTSRGKKEGGNLCSVGLWVAGEFFNDLQGSFGRAATCLLQFDYGCGTMARS